MKNINRDKKGFTLIELIAVLVILAIIALIVTPLILNIVKSAKDSANKRSVDAYGKAIDLAVATYLLDNGDFPTSIEDLKVEYSGSKVVCGVAQLNEDSSIYLSECTVEGKEVKDSSTEDGWYHYGKTSATSYQSYKIGDQITYNGMNFYVIADSDENSDSVTMLKAEPLTVDEVNKYGGVGTDNNHVNRYTIKSVGTAYNYNNNGYGGMAYYSSETCGDKANFKCTTDYAQSEIKYVVDAWAADKFQSSDLKEDNLGYNARLITLDELTTNFGYESGVNISGETIYKITENTPDWLYNSKYSYQTMSPDGDSTYYVWNVGLDGDLYSIWVFFNDCAVRPVVTILKSSLS